MIGKVRVLLDKSVQKRYHIKVPAHMRYGSVLFRDVHLTDHVAFIRHDKAVCKAAGLLHVFIVRQVIDRKHKRLLSFRQVNRLHGHLLSSVRKCFHFADVRKVHQHIAAFVHGLNDPVELRDRCHDLVVLRGFGAGKCYLFVLNQRVEENVRDLRIVLPFHELKLLRAAVLNQGQ